MYLRFLGRTLYVSREPSTAAPRFEHHYELGEHLFRFCSLSVIYTPRDWKARREREATLA